MSQMDNETIVRQLQNGQGNQQQLLEMLWNQNISLVRKIIHESTGLDHWKDQDFEDLEQQAFLGILESVSRFDFDQGNRFFTYATHYIIKNIRKYYDQYCQSIRIPSAMKAKIKRYKKAREELLSAGRNPTDSTLMECLGISEKELRNISEAEQRMKLISLEQRLQESNEESGTFLDIIPDPIQYTEKILDSVYLQELHDTLIESFEVLTSREIQIIYARYYLGQTMEEIGDTMKCTRANINCHEKNALRKLRTGRFGKELASFLPDRQEHRAIRSINQETKRKTKGLSEHEKNLLL